MQRVVGPAGALTCPTSPITETVVDAVVDVPVQPVAVTVMVAVPENAAFHTTTPPVGIVPAEPGEMLHAYDVAFDASAE